MNVIAKVRGTSEIIKITNLEFTMSDDRVTLSHITMFKDEINKIQINKFYMRWKLVI